MTASRKSFLDLVNACNCFPYNDNPELYKLFLPNDTRVHGLMQPKIVAWMPWTQSFRVDHASKSVFVEDNSNGQSLTQTCNSAFDEVVTKAIDDDLFEILHGRHSEYYRVIGANYFCQLERFAHGLFGIVARGAHATAYVQTSEGLKIWVPRRARHLFTYPGKLDSTVAGGVKASDNPVECIVAEAMEEASLPESLVKSVLKSVGILTYVTMYSSPSRKEEDLISPEVLYVYDMELSSDVVLKPHDDEVEDFFLMSVDEVKEALCNEEFKTNSAVVMIDFFIRHGIITQENEKEYVEIISRMHRHLPIATISST